MSPACRCGNTIPAPPCPVHGRPDPREELRQLYLKQAKDWHMFERIAWLLLALSVLQVVWSLWTIYSKAVPQ